jgi:hypothetical protein
LQFYFYPLLVEFSKPPQMSFGITGRSDFENSILNDVIREFKTVFLDEIGVSVDNVPRVEDDALCDIVVQYGLKLVKILPNNSINFVFGTHGSNTKELFYDRFSYKLERGVLLWRDFKDIQCDLFHVDDLCDINQYWLSAIDTVLRVYHNLYGKYSPMTNDRAVTGIPDTLLSKTPQSFHTAVMCLGCIFGEPNQEAHMGTRGCLEENDFINSNTSDEIFSP